MKFTDLHTHTAFSDGELSVPQIVSVYSKENIGLGISDHLFRNKLSTVDGIIKYLNVLGSFPVYKGCEIDLGCNQCLPDNLEDKFDYIISSVHAVSLPDGLYSLDPYFAFHADNIGDYKNHFTTCESKKVLENLLFLYESEFRRKRIDILGHCTATPFHDRLINSSFLNEWEDTLICLCRKYDVALEVNALWRSPEPRLIRKAVQNEVKLSVGSDCHKHETACDISYSVSAIESLGLPAHKCLYAVDGG